MPTFLSRFPSRTWAALLGMALAPLLPGCMDGGSRQILNRAYTELDAKQYDQADTDADEFLRAHPTGSGVAEAYYLRGRVDEGRAMDNQLSPTPADKRKYLDSAKDEYERGLQSLAPAGVKALLHTGVANVNYYEEDYAAALREWQTSLPNLQSDDTKAWVLYHIGRCHQRLGQFSKADETFKQVQRDYPGSQAALRSAARMGAEAFYVEVGAFPNVSNAESAADDLRKKGYAASRTIDAGRQIVRVGPIPTYPEVKTLQSRLRSQYPGAIISP